MALLKLNQNLISQWVDKMRSDEVTKWSRLGVGSVLGAGALGATMIFYLRAWRRARQHLEWKSLAEADEKMTIATPFETPQKAVDSSSSGVDASLPWAGVDTPSTATKHMEQAQNAVLDLAKQRHWLGVFAELDRCPDLVNGRPSYRQYGLLHQAAFWGDFAAVQTLLEIGADRNVASKDGMVAAQIAAQRGYHAIAQMLCRRSSGDTAELGRAVLQRALSGDSFDGREGDASIGHALLQGALSSSASSGHNLITLRVEGLAGDVLFEGEISSGTSIGVIKGLIRDAVGKPIEEQALVFGAQVLRNDCDLASVNAGSLVVLSLVHCRRPVGELFNEQPSTWGLRGDPTLWGKMRKRLASEPCPETKVELLHILEAAFLQCTGEVLPEVGDVESKSVRVPGDTGGGMSGGLACCPTWRCDLIPLVLARSNCS